MSKSPRRRGAAKSWDELREELLEVNEDQEPDHSAGSIFTFTRDEEPDVDDALLARVGVKLRSGPSNEIVEAADSGNNDDPESEPEVERLEDAGGAAASQDLQDPRSAGTLIAKAPILNFRSTLDDPDNEFTQAEAGTFGKAIKLRADEASVLNYATAEHSWLKDRPLVPATDEPTLPPNSPEAGEAPAEAQPSNPSGIDGEEDTDTEVSAQHMLDFDAPVKDSEFFDTGQLEPLTETTRDSDEAVVDARERTVQALDQEIEASSKSWEALMRSISLEMAGTTDAILERGAIRRHVEGQDSGTAPQRIISNLRGVFGGKESDGEVVAPAATADEVAADVDAAEDAPEPAAKSEDSSEPVAVEPATAAAEVPVVALADNHPTTVMAPLTTACILAIEADQVAEAQPATPASPVAHVDPSNGPEPEAEAAEVEPEPETASAAEPKAQVEAEPEAKAQVEAKVEPEPETAPAAEPKAQVEAGPEPETASAAEPKAQVEAEPEAKAQVEAKVEPEPETAPAVEPAAQVEADPEPDAEVETEPQPEAAAKSDDSSETVAEEPATATAEVPVVALADNDSTTVMAPLTTEDIQAIEAGHVPEAQPAAPETPAAPEDPSNGPQTEEASTATPAAPAASEFDAMVLGAAANFPGAESSKSAIEPSAPQADAANEGEPAEEAAAASEPEAKGEVDNVLVKFTNVSKRYILFKNNKRRLLGLLFGIGKQRLKWANRDLDFEIRRGESVAILGRNGAGKSTLLKMVTGVTYPSTGSVKITGKVGALLELTTGFENEFSGRENIYLKAAVMGLRRKDVAHYESEIVEFAELDEYIDQPVSTYSSGMRARLGFAITALIEPEILVVDEALSVGDAKFNAKCRAKLDELHARDDLTVLFVTHSESTAREICQRGIVLKEGGLIFDGPIDDAIKAYRASI